MRNVSSNCSSLRSSSRLAELLLAGVVHEDVEAAERLDGVGRPARGSIRGRDVGGQGDRRAAALLDERDDVAGILLLVGQVGDGDIRALAGERDRHRSADPGVASGDEGLRPSSRPVPR